MKTKAASSRPSLRFPRLRSGQAGQASRTQMKDAGRKARRYKNERLRFDESKRSLFHL
jgi:hypothetical protein